MLKFFILSALLIFSFSACSIKNYEHSEPKLITFKTKKIRYSDLGFIRHSGDALQLDLFTAGSQVYRFEINRMICTAQGCIRKSKFNEEHFDDKYYNDFLQNVILGKPIFKGKNLIKTDSGFEQNIILVGEYNISYKVSQNKIYFKDRVNKILLKIQSVEHGE